MPNPPGENRDPNTKKCNHLWFFKYNPVAQAHVDPRPLEPSQVLFTLLLRSLESRGDPSRTVLDLRVRLSLWGLSPSAPL